MPPKRKRRASPVTKGLPAGQLLKRTRLSGDAPSAWAWVGTEVSEPSQITQEHRLMTCHLSKRSTKPFCPNRYTSPVKSPNDTHPVEKSATTTKAEDDPDDIVVVSDDESNNCTKKNCRNNPNCLNHLGQDKWEDEEKARKLYIQTSELGENPAIYSRDPHIPIGLKNLGATCYANAFLQVWFRDLAFREGVYQCQLSEEKDKKVEESPIFQLQVTFAALQESTQSVYNPTRLVESLKLSTSEQQDAQEFSKLFMSLLDHEFQKQTIPVLKSLVSNQFQGQLIYGTRCCHCKKSSERATDFLELEVNIENNVRLEARIAALLRDEKLTGDNKYSCSNCLTLHDAIRYTELRRLPPVLHFSLLRFVYDFSSMERKKSKHNVLFPTVLDMGQFLKPAEDGEPMLQGRDIYELRGVLLHRGPSAYHGHYEAQVLDTSSGTWFQFDDENVVSIQSLGEKKFTGKDVVDILNGDGDKKFSASRGRPNKRPRLEENEGENLKPKSQHESRDQEDVYSSKDAYMLIYARKGSNKVDLSAGSSELSPPGKAMACIRKGNMDHAAALASYKQKEDEAVAHIARQRSAVRDIFASWQTTSIDEESIVVSRQSLETWVAKPFSKPKHPQANEGLPNIETEVEEASDILCIHEGLDPRKAGNMKRINAEAYRRISDEFSDKISPARSPDAICEICVRDLFLEKLYQIEHPRMVSQFDDCCDNDLEDNSYWISKSWVKDWRLQKPKMHSSHVDMPPDAAPFHDHVLCEHGELSLHTSARRQISARATELLKALFPSWQPPSSATTTCPICEAARSNNVEGKKEARKAAEEEKTQLRHMSENALAGNLLLLDNVACAAIPMPFVRTWKQWLSRPGESPRPDNIDNVQFLCEHDKLNFDPNCPGDLDNYVAVIQESDWRALSSLYKCGPEIALTKQVVEEPEGVFETKFVHNVPVCQECRLRRKTNFEYTELAIRLLHSKDSTEDVSSKNLSNSNTRQSRRIRQVRQRGGKTHILVSKSTTVKDIKVMIQDDLKIPTICQKLFFRDSELEDSTTTVASLGIEINDSMDLREEKESGDLSDSSDDGGTRRRSKERGFGGTLLGSSLPGSSQTTERGASSGSEGQHAGGTVCPQCTFINTLQSAQCEVCDKLF